MINNIKFKKEFAVLCDRNGIINAYYNISEDPNGIKCVGSTAIGESSICDKCDVNLRVFKCVIPLLLNEYENLTLGMLDLIQILRETTEKYELYCQIKEEI